MATNQMQFLGALRQALGTPYVWGGSAPGGFDCSGLVYWAARQAGIRGVPRTSFDQFRVGVPVGMGGLKPGDLVFSHFDGPPGSASHVVVYIGNGRVIAAPHTGTDVQIEPLSAFAGHIVGARRILANPQGNVYNASAFAGQQEKQFAAGQAAQAPQGPSPAQRLAALSLVHPIQVAPPTRPLPTALGTLQQLFGPQQSPVQQQPQPLAQPGVTSLPTGLGPTVKTPDDYAASLDAIHSQLLK